MNVVSVQTVRFTKLVESHGQPFSKTLWLKPETDVALKKAVQHNRVLTVAQSNIGTKKEFGIIGFFPEKRGSILIFPKPIPYAIGTRVIGIKWDLVKEEVPPDPIRWNQVTKRKPVARARVPAPAPMPSPPVEKEEAKAKTSNRYELVIRVRAIQEATQIVEAFTLKEAKALVMKEKFSLDPAKATVSYSVMRARKLK